MAQRSTPLVSIIIPTYNRYALLQEAIASINFQTFSDYEIIVVDDGSTDHTPQVQHHPNLTIRYFHQNNKGLNAARNTGLSNSRGQYIALLDDDDLWFADKLQIQVECLNRIPEAAFIFSDFIIFNSSGILSYRGLSTWFSEPLNWKRIFGSTFDSFELSFPFADGQRSYVCFIGNIYQALLKGPYILPSTSLIRKNMICGNQAFPVSNTHCGDWGFFARLAEHYPCVFIDAATAMNRSHHDSVRLTRKPKSERLIDRVDLINNIWKADRKFAAKNADAIYYEERRLLNNLFKALLLEGKRKQARRVIALMLRQPHFNPFRLQFYILLARIPWLHIFINGFRTMRSVLITTISR